MRHRPVPSVRARRRRALLVRVFAATMLAAVFTVWMRRAHTPETSQDLPGKPLQLSDAPADELARSTPRPTHGASARDDAAKVMAPRRFPGSEDACVSALTGANGIPAYEAAAWCRLDAPFRALMSERVNPEGTTVPHARLCGEATTALTQADRMAHAWGDCGAMGERALDWGDTAWMTGCIGDAAWMDRYRAFRLNRMGWGIGNPVCETTRQAWTQDNTDWQRRLDAADLSEIKLCVFVALKVFAPPSDDVEGLRDAMDRCYAAYPDPNQMVPFEVP